MSNTLPSKAPPMDGVIMGASMIQGLQPLAIAKHLIYLFSEPASPPAPPLASKMERLRLISIHNSSYCEKARWALEIAQADPNSPYYYVEDVHPPAFHCIFSLQATQNAQSRTPIVVFESNPQRAPVLNSDDIVRTFCPQLYPPALADAIVQLEQDLGQQLGSAARCIYFCHMLLRTDGNKQYYPLVTQMCAGSTAVPTVERTLFAKMLDKGVDQGIFDCLQLTAAANEVAEQELRQVMTDLSEYVVLRRLHESGHWMDTPEFKYGFTAADLIVATFVGNMCGDIECLQGLGSSVFMGQKEDNLPPSLQKLRNEMQATPVAAFARRIYQQNRPVGPDGRIVLRPARKGVNPLRKYFWSLTTITAAVTAAVFAGVSRSQRK
mmetsp:Transcript_22658/g.43003  ORF Transcript_22658/g.43003 Transcript_22658/m.43003 type:complete len:380 (+) Transcript_22658:137-1276(+)